MTCLVAQEGSKGLSHSLSQCFTFCGLTHTPCGVAGGPKQCSGHPHAPPHAAAFLQFSRQLPSFGKSLPAFVYLVRAHRAERPRVVDPLTRRQTLESFPVFSDVKKAAPNVCVLV